MSGRDLVLTDYDFVGRIDEPVAAPGTELYSAPSHRAGAAASPSDDLYSLAASFFHVMFEHEPFRYDGVLAKDRGLNWEAVDAEQRAEYPTVAAFLDQATRPLPDQRFQSAAEALKALAVPPTVSPPTVAPVPGGSPPTAVGPESSVAGPAPVPAPAGTEPAPLPEPSLAPGPVPPSSAEGPATVEAPDSPVVRREQRVEWLRGLLQSYPGQGTVRNPRINVPRSPSPDPTKGTARARPGCRESGPCARRTGLKRDPGQGAQWCGATCNAPPWIHPGLVSTSLRSRRAEIGCRNRSARPVSSAIPVPSARRAGVFPRAFPRARYRSVRGPAPER